MSCDTFAKFFADKISIIHFDLDADLKMEDQKGHWKNWLICYLFCLSKV